MPPNRYTRTARLLHWSTAVAIVAALVLARSFAGLQLSPHKIHLINYHKWTGLTVLWLSITRILWRLQHRPPQLPSTLAPWERNAATATHGALYVLMVATPLLGWWLSSALGFPLKYFGLIPLPAFGTKDTTAAKWIEPIHAAFAWTLLTFALLHAAAALRHHVVCRDDILRRIV